MTRNFLQRRTLCIAPQMQGAPATRGTDGAQPGLELARGRTVADWGSGADADATAFRGISGDAVVRRILASGGEKFSVSVFFACPGFLVLIKRGFVRSSHGLVSVKTNRSAVGMMKSSRCALLC